MPRCSLFLTVVLCLLASVAVAQEKKTPTAAKPKFAAEHVEFFERDVLPLLKANCFKCHGGEPKVKGALRLTSRKGVLAGGELGEIIDLENPADSALLSAVRYEDLEMPPSGRLPAAKVAVLAKWVELGVPWSKVEDYGVAPSKDEGIVDDGKYWAYQPIRNPHAPPVKNAAWVKSPIDAFLLAKIEAAGLEPAPMATKVALVRRVYYDLTGLPPSPKDVDAFVNDDSPDAWEKLIDRLLDSQQYGERWGRHWLDLVRYAETHGYERDSPKPFAWRYRDYVINAFNADKPYDQFLREQLAGDELETVTAESLTATGYYRLGIWDDEPADRLLARYDSLDDVLRTTTEVMLGMTLGCARCHDHKGDPLPQLDYYRMLAYFHDISPMNRENLRNWVNDNDRLAHKKRLEEKQAREGRLYSELYVIEQQFLSKLREKLGDAALGVRSSDLEELRFRFYRDTWKELPDFDSLKHETEGVIASSRFSLKPASRQEAIGLVFEGKLKVPQAGKYTFHINSTEGVRLRIGDANVIDRAGQGSKQVEGSVQLTAGLHPIRLDYFNGYQKPKLEVSWSGPGVAKRSLTDMGGGGGPVLLSDSRKRPEQWKYSTKKPAKDWFQADFDDSKWKSGPGGFGTRGTPGSVVRTEWRTPNIWLRRTFKVNDLPAVLSLSLHHDEDVEIYLNGVQIHQAKHYTTKYIRVPLDQKAVSALKRGENTIAVHCRQTGGGQYIDVGLLAATAELNLASLMQQHGRELLGMERVKQHRELSRQLADSRKAKPSPPGARIMSVAERGHSPVHLLVRGNPHAKGTMVEPATPAVLKTKQPERGDRKPAGSSGKRLAFADWLTAKDNPLTARVFVNRLWLHYFGRGIVPTPNDFGKLGQPPTHPDLLDWLATQFRDGGWKIKRVHKLILMSNAYRMSSQANEAGLAKDADNRWYWRHNMRRLSSEELRDSILAVTGELNLKSGGPSIYVPIAQEVLRGQSRPGAGWGKSPPAEANRRSVYIHVKRSLLVPILEMHDQADTDSSCPVRYVTTVPTQSLGMLNGSFTNEKAKRLAERLRRDAPQRLKDQVRRAVLLSTSRTPSAEEVRRDVEFIESLVKKEQLSEQRALEIYCLLTLNANEFVYLD